MSLREAWETRASDWVRWARSPELDNEFVVEALREPAALRDDGSPYVSFVHLRGRLLAGGPASS
jgi:hypothetical protein